MEKEIVQKLEWLEAQKIEISVDLFAAAKQQLHFLGVVDRNRCLYDGPILERAIYRYNAFWLPLLAKYSESYPIFEGPLVPPLDCEWVWHCHRLNPVRYKSDCEQFYGRVLDNSDVVSSANGNCKLQTENLWKRLYPMEPYDLDLDKAISEPEDISTLEKCTTYGLVSAVKRQSSFYYEVSRAHVDNDIIMQEAVGRYKAFLYLIKRNRKMSIELISVPTYDIDLIWHTHQLNPSSYYKDMEKIFGHILQHDDDTDYDDISEGKKINTVFSGTTAKWEETFGQRYWKASTETTPIVVAAEKNNSRCFAVAVEKNSARCFAVTTEKKSAKCFAMVVLADKKKNAMCFAVAVKKKSARCFAVAVLVDEKKSARCFTLADEKKSARCFAVAAEKNSASYAAVAAEKKIARCFAVVDEKKSARCFAVAVLADEKKSARCFVVTTEKKSDRCFAVADEKKSVRCFAVTAEKKSAKCFAVAAEKKGECGNMIKNNANENDPLAEALNGAVAA